MKLIRLQKYIADCGIASRRKAEELILQGRVSVNGEVVKILGTKVGGEDAVLVDGNPIDRNRIEKLYVLLNKPRGCMTTVSDPEGRKTVMDLVPEISERIYPVGRLDYLSEGLLILTNDGEMANTIMHPSHNIIKVYEVKVFGTVLEKHLEALKAGVPLGRKRVRPRSVRIIKRLAGKTWLEFRIGEGKNREIRRICEWAGLTVDKLRRVSLGGIHIAGIAPGKYVFLTKKQMLAGLAQGEYFSPKKTISVKKGGGRGLKADARTFRRFRREIYFETLAVDEADSARLDPSDRKSPTLRHPSIP